MKCRLLTFFLIACFSDAYGQIDTAYEMLIARAGFHHLRKEYKAAVLLYEDANRVHEPDALNAYKSAGAYALDSNTEKAYYYLRLALKKGWTEADLLLGDPYFNYLRQNSPAIWKQITATAYQREKEYAATLRFAALRKEINGMMIRDQSLRYKRAQTTNEKAAQLIDRQLQTFDNNNLIRAKQILRQYGWPLISDIGKDGVNNFWLLVQHADRDIRFQQEALLLLEKLQTTAEINPENYAFLYDRVQCNLNHRQKYGTQVNWTQNGMASGFRSILDEPQADSRRAALQLLPLKIYALTYGFEYTPQNDSADLAHSRQLTDSAKLYYQQQQYPQMYDAYNNASVVLDGMTNEDMLEAARLFADVYAHNRQSKYSGIAVDFLELLDFRNYLTKEKVNRLQLPETDPRWMKIYRHLK